MEYVEVEPIQLELDEDLFPQITQRYTPEKLVAMFYQLCERTNQPYTKETLMTMLVCLESDLAGMFPYP